MYPLKKEGLGPKRRSGGFEEEKKLLSLTKIETRSPSFPARRLLTISTGSYRVEIRFKLLPACTGNAAVHSHGS